MERSLLQQTKFVQASFVMEKSFGTIQGQQKQAGYLNDDWDGQVYIMGVDQANSAASEARKSPMHCPLP